MTSLTPDEYQRYDATGLAQLVATGDISPTELTETAIAMIEEGNSSINAVVTTCFEEALASAETLPPGPLRGVPWLLKDFTTDVEGLPMSNGSRALASNVSAADGELVTRHRNAGLVILGKTNSPEFGMNVCTSPTMFGASRHPLDASRSVGGSSGGSGAAVAAGMLPAAHATDSGGSIRIPASACGLFGLKPSRNRVPLGNNQSEGLGGLSTAHALTRSVRDSALLLDLTHGPLPGDSYGPPQPGGSFLGALEHPLPDLRLGLCTVGFAGEAVHPECARAAMDAAELLQSLGCSVEVVAPPIDGERLRDALDTIFCVNIAGVVDGLPSGTDLDDLEPATRAAVEYSRQFSGVDYVRALSVIREITGQLAEFFREFDALLTPTVAHPPRPIGYHTATEPDWATFLERMLDDIPFTPLFNASGGPAMSVPLGRASSGLPIGVQVGAALGKEDTLLRLARELETAAPWHQLQ